jgi:hypothetical protein
MKLLRLGVLFTISTFLLAQEPIARGDETPLNAAEAAVDSADQMSASAALDPLTPGQKAKRRVVRLVEPITLASSAFGAGFEQWRNRPPEWGQGSNGYARRFASAEGFTAAHNAVALGFDIAFHLDPRYRRMPHAGFGPRLWNAVSQTFIANKDSGGKMINVSEIAGNFGAGFIANSWQPAGYNSVGDGLTRGVLGIAYHTAKNVAREFLPDLLHPGRRRSSTGKGP